MLGHCFENKCLKWGKKNSVIIISEHSQSSISFLTSFRLVNTFILRVCYKNILFIYVVEPQEYTYFSDQMYVYITYIIYYTCRKYQGTVKYLY